MNDCVFVITHDGVTLSRYAIRVVSEVSPVYSVARPRRAVLPVCISVDAVEKKFYQTKHSPFWNSVQRGVLWVMKHFFISDMAKCKMIATLWAVRSVMEVHGLAESRPSVPKGDRLYAKESGLIHVWRVDPMYLKPRDTVLRMKRKLHNAA